MTTDVGLEQYGKNTLADDGCSTCGDTAVTVKVIEVQALLVNMGVASGRALEVRL